jgi:hypothetical protein
MLGNVPPPPQQLRIYPQHRWGNIKRGREYGGKGSGKCNVKMERRNVGDLYVKGQTKSKRKGKYS